MQNIFLIMIKTSDFDYELPQELIAQTPLKDRKTSRMMVLHKNSGAFCFMRQLRRS